MSNIDKQARQVSRYDLVSGYMQKWPDGEFVYHSDYQALLDELEAKDRRIADQGGIIQSARKFISEYAGLGDVGAAEFIKIIDRAAGKGE